MSKHEDAALSVRELAQVMIALNPNSVSKNEMVKRLHSFAMKPSAIASILGMPLKDVTSATSKLNKAKNGARKETARA